MMIKILVLLIWVSVILEAAKIPFLPPFLLRNPQIFDFQLSNKTNSGIALAISNDFYKNSSIQFLSDLSGILKNIKIPDMYDEKEIIFMNFIFNMSNITISTINFDNSQFSVKFQSDNTTDVKIVASTLFISFQYVIQYGLIDIKQSGYIDLEGLSINFNLNISKNESQQLNIALSSLYLDYTKLFLNFGDWLDKKILAYLTQETIDLIWPLIESKISSSLQSAIQKSIDKVTQDIPNEIDLPDSDVNLDISLTNGPFVLGNYFIINVNGDFYKRNSTPEILVPPIPFQVNLTENVSQIFLHQITINSLFKHIFDTHILNYTIFGNITNGFGVNLDSRTINGLFPELKNMPTQEISFLIENQIDYQPTIAFIKGDDHSKSHINLMANLTASLYIGNSSQFNHYVTANFSFSADFRIVTLKEGFVLKTNNIKLNSIITSDQDANKINKEAALKDGNIFLNLGVSDLNKELYKMVLKFPNIMSLEIKCDTFNIYDTYVVADVEINSNLKSYMKSIFSRN